MAVLEEGVELKHVYFEKENTLSVGPAKYQAKSIVVTMEAGQMGRVPWAKVTHNDGAVNVFNLAKADGVHLLNKGEK